MTLPGDVEHDCKRYGQALQDFLGEYESLCRRRGFCIVSDGESIQISSRDDLGDPQWDSLWYVLDYRDGAKPTEPR